MVRFFPGLLPPDLPKNVVYRRVATQTVQAAVLQSAAVETRWPALPERKPVSVLRLLRSVFRATA